MLKRYKKLKVGNLGLDEVGGKDRIVEISSESLVCIGSG